MNQVQQPKFVLVHQGDHWQVMAAASGLIAGYRQGDGIFPWVWRSVEGALDFIAILEDPTRRLMRPLVWGQSFPTPVPEEAAEPQVQKTWAPVRFPTYEQRVKAVSDAVALPVPNTPMDKYKLLRAVEDLLAAR